VQPTFEAMKSNYISLISQATVLPSREAEVAAVAEYLIRDKAIYLMVEQKTHVPAAVLMALAEREMDGNLHCYLGNGQNLKRRTTIVPIGRGPFMETFPNDFIAGCLDSLALDGLDKVWQDNPEGWSLDRFAFEMESWNGWGYRARGIPSPYVFGATTVQRPGKFPRDHVFVATEMDPQIGTLAIVEEIVKQDPSLQFADSVPKVADASIVPVVQPHPIMGTIDIRYIQLSLNKIKAKGTPLLTDGNCGPATRAAVRYFQAAHRLLIDGIPGPQVLSAIKQSLAEAGMA
jgi:lysozyme family protein